MLKDKKQATPNPLIDEHPADTLVHVQSVLSFLQEYTAKSTESVETTPHNVRVNTGVYNVLRIVSDAIDFEIDRLETCLLYTSPSPRDRG